jgi:hypothetical protein
MEAFFIESYNWWNFLVAALLLYGIYALLYVIKEWLEGSKRVVGPRAWAYRIVAPFLLLYQPLTVLILATIFVFINPLVHGLLLLIVVVAGFAPLRDYLSGRVILFNPQVAEGKRMRTAQASGVISQLGRIGLYLQTSEGLHFVNYSTLLKEGYSLITNQDIGGYYQLVLTPPAGAARPLEQLLDRFTTTPYLDRSFRPELQEGDGGQGKIRARLAIREEQQLNELLRLIEEWGYTARVAKR